MAFNFDKVRDILRCPVSGADLVEDSGRLVSVDSETRRSFPIVDDVPRLLEEESVELSVEEWKAVMSRSQTVEHQAS